MSLKKYLEDAAFSMNKVAKHYAELVDSRITAKHYAESVSRKNEGAGASSTVTMDELHEDIRMLNHIASALERIYRAMEIAPNCEEERVKDVPIR